jgi:hypothetical protein
MKISQQLRVAEREAQRLSVNGEICMVCYCPEQDKLFVALSRDLDESGMVAVLSRHQFGEAVSA